MIAMVLAAGLGTRLRPLTERIAKPALPILGSTLLEGNLLLLRRAGVDEVVVNAHHLPATVAAAAREAAERLGVRLHLSFEPDVLGTGGGLANARPLLDRGEPFFLVNGDVLCDLDLRAAWQAHLQSGAAATLVLRPMPEGAGFASVETDAAGDVIRIAGQGRSDRPAAGFWLFTGIHVLGPSIFEVLPEGFSCVNRQGHVVRIARGDRVHGHVQPGGRWSDVGTPARYLEANLDRLEGRYALPPAFGAAVERQPGVWIDPTAEVDPRARLLGPCYVGAGARIGPAAVVGPRAAVLAGGGCDGRLRDAVVAPGASLASDAEAVGTLVV